VRVLVFAQTLAFNSEGIQPGVEGLIHMVIQHLPCLGAENLCEEQKMTEYFPFPLIVHKGSGHSEMKINR
jgi:hypothetical protein